MNNARKMLPESFIKRLEKIVPIDYLEPVLSSFSQPRPTTFRANTLKISSENLKKQLHNLSIIYKTVDWYKEAFVLVSPSKKEFIETDLYKNGMVYVQSLSSMIPPLVLDSRPNEKVCDLTAAPGSKTTQIAMMMENAGEIVANDKSRVRLYKLIANLKMQGVANAKVTSLPGQILWRNYPEYFDKTLVEVPCSMEGRFCTLDEKSYQDWSLKKV
ncbi:MAG: RsmB/NOP family class I SAM-dependent RNA methyltransferase, partial [Patescibacteria group bacterium]